MKQSTKKRGKQETGEETAGAGNPAATDSIVSRHGGGSVERHRSGYHAADFLFPQQVNGRR